MSEKMNQFEVAALLSTTGLPDIAQANVLFELFEHSNAEPSKEQYANLARENDRMTRKLNAIESALSRHPTCDVHDENEGISCGWKSAVRDITWAMHHS